VSVVSLLNVAEFSRQLAGQPDQNAASYVINGLRHGFWLGLHHTHRLKSAKKKKPSALQHPSMINNYLANEDTLHWAAGPFISPPLPNLHVSTFGVIPTKGQQGKWHRTVDPSSSSGSSVNDAINVEEFHALHEGRADYPYGCKVWARGFNGKV